MVKHFILFTFQANSQVSMAKHIHLVFFTVLINLFKIPIRNSMHMSTENSNRSKANLYNVGITDTKQAHYSTFSWKKKKTLIYIPSVALDFGIPSCLGQEISGIIELPMAWGCSQWDWKAPAGSPAGSMSLPRVELKWPILKSTSNHSSPPQTPASSVTRKN